MDLLVIFFYIDSISLNCIVLFPIFLQFISHRRRMQWPENIDFTKNHHSEAWSYPYVCDKSKVYSVKLTVRLLFDCLWDFNTTRDIHIFGWMNLSEGDKKSNLSAYQIAKMMSWTPTGVFLTSHLKKEFMGTKHLVSNACIWLSGESVLKFK